MKQLWIDIRVRLAAVFTRDALRARADEEIATHIEMREQRLIESGMSAPDARAQARREFGNRTLTQEKTVDSWRYAMVDTILQDIRYAIRMLWRAPGFTTVAVLSLALGIGANAALFSLVDALLLRDLPIKDPDQLVQVMRIKGANGFGKPVSFDRAMYDSLKGLSPIFSDVGGYVGYDPAPDVSIENAAEPARQVVRVTGNFFSVLGVAPAIGRVESETPAAIISHQFWIARFQGDRNVLGRVITVDGEPYPITGVAPAGFLGLSLNSSMDMWLIRPSSTAPPPTVIARLQSGVTLDRAQTAADALFRSADGDGLEVQAQVTPAGKGSTDLRNEYRRPLLALMILVALVLLIACTNIGNLMVAKNTSRIPELTVRTAMGARRSRLVAQLMVESLVLAAAGGALAWLVAQSGVAAILAMLPLTEVPEQLTLRMDARMLGFMSGISLLSALLFSLAPAWRATRVDLVAGLKAVTHTTASRTRRRLDHWLVAGQVALSVILLAGAGLFLQTLRNTASIHPGFDANNLVQLQTDTRAAGYGPAQTPLANLYRLLPERLAAVRGVESVTSSRNSLLTGAGGVWFFPAQGVNQTVNVTDVGPRFFETMRIPLVDGRVFSAEDATRTDAEPVIVSESYAKQFYPGESAVGKPLLASGDPIIGVVGDAKLVGIRGRTYPMIYRLGLRGRLDRVSSFLVRTSGDPETVLRAVQETVQQIHPRLLVSTRTIEETIGRSLARERMVASISAFFGALGLVLAGIGLFGVASFTVAQKTSEIGIRIALGAGRWEVITGSLRDTAIVFGIGLASGGAAALAIARVAAAKIEELLFGLSATDWTNIAAACLVMLAAGIAACLIPALRAARVDPLRAIRCE